IITLAYSAELPPDARNTVANTYSACYLPHYDIKRLRAVAEDFSRPKTAHELENENQVQPVAEKIKSYLISAFSDVASDFGRRVIRQVKLDETTSPAECDVLLQNHDGKVMERLLGPPASGGMVIGGCKVGVSRRWALENSEAREAVLLAYELEEGEVTRLSSAVGGFIQDLVTLPWDRFTA
ncbi:aminodeoxychorismate lyase, partial [Colletotrichum incanum]